MFQSDRLSGIVKVPNGLERRLSIRQEKDIRCVAFCVPKRHEPTGSAHRRWYDIAKLVMASAAKAEVYRFKSGYLLKNAKSLPVIS